MWRLHFWIVFLIGASVNLTALFPSNVSPREPLDLCSFAGCAAVCVLGSAGLCLMRIHDSPGWLRLASAFAQNAMAPLFLGFALGDLCLLAGTEDLGNWNQLLFSGFGGILMLSVGFCSLQHNASVSNSAERS